MNNFFGCRKRLCEGFSWISLINASSAKPRKGSTGKKLFPKNFQGRRIKGKILSIFLPCDFHEWDFWGWKGAKSWKWRVEVQPNRARRNLKCSLWNWATWKKRMLHKSLSGDKVFACLAMTKSKSELWAPKKFSVHESQSKERQQTQSTHCGPRTQHGKEKCYVTSISRDENSVAARRKLSINRRNKTVVNETSRDNCSV